MSPGKAVPHKQRSNSQHKAVAGDKKKKKQRKVVIGVCAMEVKSHAKSMQEVLKRLEAYGVFSIVLFTNRQLLETPIEEWPVCDFLISFFSKRFPLDKAIAYRKRLGDKTVSIQDLESQKRLWNREAIYKKLTSVGVPVPRHIVVHRNPDEREEALAAASTPSNAEFDLPDPPGFVETNDYVELDGERIYKPFVEKPLSAENHNIVIYYPKNDKYTGGCNELFRKVGNSSSLYRPEVSRVRKDDTYIYEEFFETNDSRDVKVYSVGTNYQHCETRKAPHVDGVVERNAEGFEMRQTTRLSEAETVAVQKIIKAFKQTVCGLDILRVGQDEFYVCDVNGWSMAKGNPQYYDRAARALAESIWTARHPKILSYGGKSLRPLSLFSSEGLLSSVDDTGRKLKGLVGIFRHGDRTPKQKVKAKIRHRGIMTLMLNPDRPNKSVKMKNATPEECAAIAGIARVIRETLAQASVDPDPQLEKSLQDTFRTDQIDDFGLALSVLEENLPGIKLQLKPIKFASVQTFEQATVEQSHAKDEDDATYDASPPETTSDKQYAAVARIRPGKKAESTSKDLQRPGSIDDVIECLFICKWGGMLTHGGRSQSRELGRRFRVERFADLRAREVRISTNSERRVIASAEEFAKGLLATEQLTGLIKRNELSLEQNVPLLGSTHLAKAYMEEMKLRLSKAMHLESIPDHWAGEWHAVRSPIKAMRSIYRGVRKISIALQHLHLTRGNRMLCNQEDLRSCCLRWKRLAGALYSSKTRRFEISKASDVFDNLKFDATHNIALMRELPALYLDARAAGQDVKDLDMDAKEDQEPLELDIDALYDVVSRVADLVVPAEYGMDANDKLDIGFSIARPLLEEVLADIRKMADGKSRNATASLFFTSESHLHSLLNILAHSGLGGVKRYKTAPLELAYLTHIVFLVYEHEDKSAESRFRVELRMSSGTSVSPFHSESTSDTHILEMASESTLHPDIGLDVLENQFLKGTSGRGEDHESSDDEEVKRSGH